MALRVFWLPATLFPGPHNPIEQAFAKLKALLRKAAARTIDDLWRAIADSFDELKADDCANFFQNTGYASNQSGTALGRSMKGRILGARSSPRRDSMSAERQQGTAYQMEAMRHGAAGEGRTGPGAHEEQ